MRRAIETPALACGANVAATTTPSRPSSAIFSIAEGRFRVVVGTVSNCRCRALFAVFAAFAIFAFLFSPARAQGPMGNASAGSCWQCHRQPNVEGMNGIVAANALCQDCHAKADTVRRVEGKDVPLQIRAADF